MERRILAAFTRAADTSHAASLQPEPSRREELKAESLTLLNSALKLLDDCRNQRSNVTKGLAIRTAGEFLIIAAETCLKCNQPTLAHLTTKSYFAQPSLTTGPPTTSSDQYTCRALFILAQTTMQRSPSVPPPNDAALPADRSIENVNGAEKLRQTLQAVGTELLDERVDRMANCDAGVTHEDHFVCGPTNPPPPRFARAQNTSSRPSPSPSPPRRPPPPQPSPSTRSSSPTPPSTSGT